MKTLNKFLRGLFYILPGVLFFSYYPVISFGANETMNFEMSFPMIWLVVFDVAFVVFLIKEKRQKEVWQDLRKGWKWLILPLFVTISVFWSYNFSRGVLTCGVMWLVFVAIYAFLKLKKIFYDERVFGYVFLKVFLGSTLVICVWCVVQCILDVAGVSRECTLMCRGCASQMFGFPHPNGFAIEPQFMGNLLLAPIVFVAWLYIYKSHKGLLLYLLAFVATLFLTFSRGAIYALMVGLIFMSAFWVVKERKKIIKKVGIVWGVVILAFVLTLNLQGLMAEVGPTNDNYMSGAAKVLNHLSLGIIDVGGNDGEVLDDNVVIVEDSPNDNEAIFDGYVEESTNIRMEFTQNALKVWGRDLKTMLFGVGIGGAGQAMYDEGLTGSPKEIVQNEYASLLVEIGVVGVGLFVYLIVMIIKVFIKNSNGMMLVSLLVTYGVSLLFFSGMANALQIYLMPAALYVAEVYDCKKLNNKRQKVKRSVS